MCSRPVVAPRKLDSLSRSSQLQAAQNHQGDAYGHRQKLYLNYSLIIIKVASFGGCQVWRLASTGTSKYGCRRACDP